MEKAKLNEEDKDNLSLIPLKKSDKRKRKSWTQIHRVRKLLWRLASDEVLAKPKLQVTYVANKKAKIVKWKYNSCNTTTAEDSSPR